MQHPQLALAFAASGRVPSGARRAAERVRRLSEAPPCVQLRRTDEIGVSADPEIAARAVVAARRVAEELAGSE